MIEKVRIKNYKSIKDLQFNCKKLNIFIGEPNSGKSNIIEALSLKSQNTIGTNLNKEIIRYKSVSDIFYDFNINEQIEVETDSSKLVINYAINEKGLILNRFYFYFDINSKNLKPYELSHNGNFGQIGDGGSTNVHYYEFKRLQNFRNNFIPHLSVPFGENLPTLLISNPEFKRWVSGFLKEKGLSLTIKPVENDIAASKLVDEEIYSYPYSSLSETLQRIIFYIVALETNKDNVLLFDEPETNTFPLYSKFLAERIALDTTNQFFITTHNPYLLINLIEKSKLENINIFIAQMKDYKTVLNQLNEEQISQVLELSADVFLNFDKILSI